MLKAFSTKKLLSRRSILVLSTICVLGLFGFYSVQKAAEDKKDSLKHFIKDQVIAVSQTINPELIKQLSFSQQDIMNPAFQQLRSHMISYAKFINLRAIYSMVSIDGKIYFGPESLEEGDPLASPPGTLYEQPTTELKALFNNPKAITIGPYTDEYGTFISALAPIIEPLSGTVLIVIGIDIPYDKWQADIREAKIMALLPCGFLFLIFLAFFLMTNSLRLFPHQKNNPVLRYEETLYFGFLGFSLALISGTLMMQSIKKELWESFHRSSDGYINDLVDEFQDIRRDFANIADTVSMNSDFGEISFEKFSTRFIRSPGVQYVAWLPSGGTNSFSLPFQLYKPDKSGKLKGIANNQAPHLSPENIFAEEKMSLPSEKYNNHHALRSAYEKAQKTLLPVASAPIKISQNSLKEYDIHVYYPPLSTGFEQDRSRGSLAGTINTQAIFASVFRNTDFEQMEDYDLQDITDVSLPIDIVDFPSHGLDTKKLNTDPEYYRSFPIFFGGRTYVARAYNDPHLVFKKALFLGILTFLAINIITILIAGFISILTRREEYLSKLVDIKTKELNASETKYRSLFEKNEAVMLLINPKNGVIKLANKAAELFYGWSNDELLKKSMTDIVPKSSKIIQNALKAAADGNSKMFRSRQILADGTLRDVEIYPSPIIENGETFLISIVIDVTKRLESERSLHTIYKSLHTGLIVVDASTHKIIEANHAAQKMMGLSRPKIVGKPLSNFLGSHRRDNFLLDNGKIGENLESVLQRKDRSEIPILKTIMPIELNNKHCILVTFVDISKQKEAALALKELSTRLTLATRASGAGVWEYDPIKNILIWDEQMLAIYGIDHQKFMGSLEFWLETIHPDDFSEFQIKLKNSLSSGDELDTEFRIVRSDGAINYLRIMAIIQRNEVGKATKIVGTNWDITKQKQHALEKEQMLNQIQHQERLASLGTLAAGIGHEINNPLAIINGYVDMLGKDKNGERTEEFIKKIKNASDRIVGIVKGIRSFARANTTTIKKVNLHIAILETLDLIKIMFEKDNLVIETKLNATAPEINATMGGLQQVIMNMLTNARDAIKEKGDSGKITIETEDYENSVHLYISDDGIGFEGKQARQIFDPFFTTKDPGKGTGLGLSITQNLVKSFNGIITVKSTRNIGTTFSFAFPASITAKQPITPDPIFHAGRDQEQASLMGLKVLIVDDEKEILGILRTDLETLGLSVSEANDGVDALIKLKENTFDFVITDLQMPRMNGDILILNGKDLAHLSKTKFIVITGNNIDDYPQERQDVLHGLADAFIKKPFSNDDILNAINSSLTQNSRGALQEDKKAS